ncbi:hypothetical protein PM10SUCC1_13180 [Propionigenium maris DSM 9537]|uniref:Dienelactone hydrolase domain-containing protein n=1 Tax=Propionigenium maris DSM 9537 TaxID=1123000 RepID=A0A9W6LMH4_9FUSO|nr:dienelactone hydrolase family protein [Propionigenium maris]GLI55804.1 hypothetical protein PM10SUCC1_13180 [Propionigenium maris DSM 9537]
MKKFFLILIIFLTACSNSPKDPMEPPKISVAGERVEYLDGEEVFSGYLVYERSKKGKRPGILLIHHWLGLDDFTMREADRFAEAGYLVMAMDMYGRDVKVTSHEDAAKFSGYYRENRDLMRGRIESAIGELKKNPHVDTDNLAVVGYCFGGDALIDYMLYSEEFKAGISFHGFYTSPLVESDLKGRLQIHHGILDTISTVDQLNKFMVVHPEIEAYLYKEAGHGFTVPEGSSYNREAAREAFERAKSFLKRNLYTKGEDEFLNYSTVIEAPIEEVFSYFNEVGKNIHWIKGFSGEETLYKEEGTYLNSRFIQKIRSMGMDMKFLGVITSYAEPTYLEMYYSDPRFIIRLEYILEEVEEGTKVTHRAYSVDSNSFINFFNKRILKKQMKRLKKAVEENKQ